MANNISLKVKCIKCDQSLMDYKNEINHQPSIFVNIKNEDGEKGNLWLCSTYGCYDKQCSVPLHEGSHVKMYCPHCGKLLNTDIDCKCEGDGKIVKFSIEIGGIVSICSRVGCPNHYVMVDDLENTLRKFYRTYGN